MEKSARPHYILILISTIKMLAVLIVFFAAAVAVSPNKYYSALNLLKMLIPLSVLIYAYLFYFWHSVTITFFEDKFIFNMAAGRKNHIEVSYSDIESITLKQGFLEKIFGVTRIFVSIKDVEKTYGGNIMVLEQYLVFETSLAKEIAEQIQNK